MIKRCYETVIWDLFFYFFGLYRDLLSLKLVLPIFCFQIPFFSFYIKHSISNEFYTILWNEVALLSVNENNTNKNNYNTIRLKFGNVKETQGIQWKHCMRLSFLAIKNFMNPNKGKEQITNKTIKLKKFDKTTMNHLNIDHSENVFCVICEGSPPNRMSEWGEIGLWFNQIPKCSCEKLNKNKENFLSFFHFLLKWIIDIFLQFLKRNSIPIFHSYPKLSWIWLKISLSHFTVKIFWLH